MLALAALQLLVHLYNDLQRLRSAMPPVTSICCIDAWNAADLSNLPLMDLAQCQLAW